MLRRAAVCWFVLRGVVRLGAREPDLSRAGIYFSWVLRCQNGRWVRSFRNGYDAEVGRIWHILVRGWDTFCRAKGPDEFEWWNTVSLLFWFMPAGCRTNGARGILLKNLKQRIV
jgi:hypothetical protein